MPSIPARTRIVILQHPREKRVAIGTGRMASLCLPSASLHLGVDFARDAAVQAAIADPDRPAALLWPGEGAVDVAASPPPGPITLVVVDGTWAQAKKVVRQNPFLAALPRYAFVPAAPSAYRIRREPRADYVSTIEALVEVLAVLEGDRFRPMLAPFTAMIDAQIDFAERLHGGARYRRAKPSPKPGRLPMELRSAPLLCVAGEANAWPYKSGESHPDELVHWTARRLGTGETFEAVLAPRRPLAPMTASHTRIAEAELLAGETIAAFAERWRAFARDDDVVLAWGAYALSLLRNEGGFLPERRIDLRKVSGDYFKERPGAIDDLRERRGWAASESFGRGRGGDRLGRICQVAESLATAAQRTSIPGADGALR